MIAPVGAEKLSLQTQQDKNSYETKYLNVDLFSHVAD